MSPPLFISTSASATIDFSIEIDKAVFLLAYSAIVYMVDVCSIETQKPNHGLSIHPMRRPKAIK
jgi:hypothetical protein